jgi:hypothetical protein
MWKMAKHGHDLRARVLCCKRRKRQQARITYKATLSATLELTFPLNLQEKAQLSIIIPTLPT